MQEKWNHFVYDLCEAKNKDVDEDIYHSLIENQLQLLGWAKWKGEIYPAGAAMTGRPRCDRKFEFIPHTRTYISPDQPWPRSQCSS